MAFDSNKMVIKNEPHNKNHIITKPTIKIETKWNEAIRKQFMSIKSQCKQYLAREKWREEKKATRENH